MPRIYAALAAEGVHLNMLALYRSGGMQVRRAAPPTVLGGGRFASLAAGAAPSNRGLHHLQASTLRPC